MKQNVSYQKGHWKGRKYMNFCMFGSGDSSRAECRWRRSLTLWIVWNSTVQHWMIGDSDFKLRLLEVAQIRVCCHALLTPGNYYVNSGCQHAWCSTWYYIFGGLCGPCEWVMLGSLCITFMCTTGSVGEKARHGVLFGVCWPAAVYALVHVKA